MRRDLRTKKLKKKHLKASDINVINRFDVDGQSVKVVNSIDEIKKEHILAEANIPAAFRSSGVRPLASISHHARRRRPSILELNLNLDTTVEDQAIAKSSTDSDKTLKKSDKTSQGSDKTPKGIDMTSIGSDNFSNNSDKASNGSYKLHETISVNGTHKGSSKLQKKSRNKPKKSAKY